MHYQYFVFPGLFEYLLKAYIGTSKGEQIMKSPGLHSGLSLTYILPTLEKPHKLSGSTFLNCKVIGNIWAFPDLMFYWSPESYSQTDTFGVNNSKTYTYANVS